MDTIIMGTVPTIILVIWLISHFRPTYVHIVTRYSVLPDITVVMGVFSSKKKAIKFTRELITSTLKAQNREKLLDICNIMEYTDLEKLSNGMLAQMIIDKINNKSRYNILCFQLSINIQHSLVR